MEPQLSVVLFRYKAVNADVNELNKQLVRRAQTDGRVYIAGARVDDTEAVRACFVNFRTQEDDIHMLIEVMEEIGAELDA